MKLKMIENTCLVNLYVEICDVGYIFLVIFKFEIDDAERTYNAIIKFLLK